MENLDILNIDVDTAYGKKNLDITDMRYDLNFDNTQVDMITFNNLTLTKEMEKQIEQKLIDVLNQHLDEQDDIDFDNLFEVESALDDFLDDRHNTTLYDIKKHAEELLEQEIKEETKEFLIGVLESINDGEERLSDHFRERKDGGYILEASIFFRTDTRHVIAEFDSCSLARNTYYPIGEAVIEFNCQL